MIRDRVFSFLLAGLACVHVRGVAAWEVSGVVAGEARAFFSDPVDPRQYDDFGLSAYIEPEFYTSWDDGGQRLVFTPFGRVDQRDGKRTHADIRELAWSRLEDDWELRIGFRRVFWGVTEFLHLVDIINQTDLVEDIDGEEKLGQPMVDLALMRDWGTLDFFALPYFRERTFPGTEGRLRFELPIDAGLTQYESAAKQTHTDWAARWYQVIGDWEIGLSHFYGTSREPRLMPTFNGQELVLAPFYDLIHQTSLDAQMVYGDWLWKLELLRREGHGETFFAGTGGFEYTLFGILDSPADIGLITEYAYDGRSELAPPQPFKNDIVLGLRLALNDAQSTQILFSYVRDLGEGSRFFNLEASRRIGDSLKLSLEGRFFVAVDQSNPLYGARDDDYARLELGWYF